MSNPRQQTPPAVIALAALLLGACAARPPVMDAPAPQSRIAPVAARCANCPTPDKDYAPAPDEIPADVANTPDAVPTVEPKSRAGNPESYDALGEHYVVIQEQPRNYTERGGASWYGKKFHGRRTANGERYDMFKMTAAHKTLRLPSYARVTNISNGRSVVVRINDRGPFHRGRIVDLSYAAAAKLGMLHVGATEVELEVLSPEHGDAAIESSSGKPRYLEVGRFEDPIELLALREKLSNLGFRDFEILESANAAGDGNEQRLRLGPFKDFAALEAARKKLGNRKLRAMPVVD